MDRRKKSCYSENEKLDSRQFLEELKESNKYKLVLKHQ